MPNPKEKPLTGYTSIQRTKWSPLFLSVCLLLYHLVHLFKVTTGNNSQWHHFELLLVWRQDMMWHTPVRGSGWKGELIKTQKSMFCSSAYQIKPPTAACYFALPVLAAGWQVSMNAASIIRHHLKYHWMKNTQLVTYSTHENWQFVKRVENWNAVGNDKKPEEVSSWCKVLKQRTWE